MPDPRPMPAASSRPWHHRTAVRVLLGFVLMAAVAAGGSARPAFGASTWTANLWVKGTFVYQDPYWNACTAAATMTMLNVIAARGTGGEGFAWAQSKLKHSDDPAELRDMTSILDHARATDTLDEAGVGSDPHGWRNALNHYGWGDAAMMDANLMPYHDRAYPRLKGAVKAAVRGIARLRMPVGLLAWAGGHAQVMTGYVVTGADPRVSNDFKVEAVYLSDPLRSDDIVNRKVSWSTLKTGGLKVRFRAYTEADSPYDDPYVEGEIPGSVPPAAGPSEWYGRWVIVLPVRNGLPPPGDG